MITTTHSTPAMTIGHLRVLIEDLADDTPVHLLNSWGEFTSPIPVAFQDLCPGDPARAAFPRDSFVLSGEPQTH